MKKHLLAYPIIALIALLNQSCMVEDAIALEATSQQKVPFDIMITRDGKLLTKNSGVLLEDAEPASLDGSQSFGVIGIDAITHELIIDNNQAMSDASGNWFSYMDSFNGSNDIDISAYYPYKETVEYGRGNATYRIGYNSDDVDAGPLVSKTVRQSANMMFAIPLTFQHITNDLGFKVCDITADDNLKGLIHLRKLVAANIASVGVYIDTIGTGGGRWREQSYYRNVTVFEGDAPVGIGSEGELFVGKDCLTESKAASSRFYSVPSSIQMGFQHVQAVFDVDGFTHNGYYYQPLKDQTASFLLYGLLPDNEFKLGKQYTFHIGLDLGTIYPEITFNPTVAGWETKIFENNEDF